jgi:hypothetical protein
MPIDKREEFVDQVLDQVRAWCAREYGPYCEARRAAAATFLSTVRAELRHRLLD